MKIIDNKKDYYDYLIGKYGIDEKYVFDRRTYKVFNEKYLTSETDDRIKAIFSINKQPFDRPLYQSYVFSKRKIYYQQHGELYSFILEIGFIRHYFDVERFLDNVNNLVKNIQYIGAKRVEEKLIDKHIVLYHCKTGFYWEKTREMSDFEIQYNKNNSPVTFMEFLLKDTFFPKYIDAETVYMALTEYLAAKAESHISDNRTDKQKLESAGFDNKTSFRHPVK
jgi:hypothetical protein